MKGLCRFWLIIIFFAVPVVVPAQELLLEQPEGGEDSIAYVRDFPGKYNLRLILRERPMYLQLHNEAGRVEYRPNIRPSIGFGFNILDVGLSFSVKMPPGIGNGRNRLGNTRLRDYQLGVFVKHFLLEAFYQDVTGFYMTNPVEWEDKFRFDGRPPLREDLSIRRAAFSSIYIFDLDKLTLRVYNNARRQLRGAGSFLMMAALDHFQVRSGHLVLPTNLEEYYAEDARLAGGQFTGLSFMPGYSHNFIVENFYMNLTIAAGPDLQYREYQTANASHSNWQLQGKINIRGAVGYDNDVFFVGVHFVDQRNRYKAGGMDIVHNTGVMRLSVGHRFTETRWMKSVRNWELYQSAMNFF